MVAHVAVGKRIKRIDAPRKLTGEEKFTADLQLPGLLYARPVGSAYAHARIKGVDKQPALAIPGVVAVLTADDLPVAKDERGEPATTLLAREEAVHTGQIIALVLAETEAAAQDGSLAVEVDYEPMPVISTLDQALDPKSAHVRELEIVAGSDEASMHNADAAQQAESDDEALPPNVSNSIHFHRGDIDKGFAEADEIVDLTFDSLTVHQGYIEPQTCLATISPLGKLTVYASTQAVFHGRRKVAETLGFDLHDVELVPMPVGGGFGGKFVLVEPTVAAAAVAVKRPVLMQYTRMEDFLAGNPAPDCRIQLKVGAKQDGTLTALQSRMVFDTGDSSASPLQIAAILMGGYYRVPNLDIHGYEVLTHKPAAGAYRAPGAQQGTLAIESVMDELARRLQLDPIEFRLHNCVVEGDPRPNGSPWPNIGLKECLEAVQKHPRWQQREEARRQGHGVGIAAGGWPGAIEPATAVCRLDQDGKLTIVLGSVDLNGTNTSFAQITAETFGMDVEDIAVTTASSDAAPYAGGTGGSKITYTVGVAVQRAAEDAKQQMLNIAAQHLEAAVEDLELTNGMVRVKGVPDRGVSLQDIASMSMGFGQKYAPVYGRGESAQTESAPGFAVHLAEVAVDELTGETQVVHYVAAQDVGFAINPAAVEAQMHGGAGQGIGWALYEGMNYDSDGQLLNASFMDYALPKAEMLPPMETILVEKGSEHGPYGARGVGEPPAIPGAATVLNAIRDATGVRVTSIPVKPQTLVQQMAAADGHR